jgi:hypothetical protein
LREPRERDRRAHLLGDDVGHVLEPRRVDLGESLHDGAPLGRGHARPFAAIERLARDPDGAVDVGLGRFGDAPDRFFGVRRDHLDDAVARRGNPLAADEELVVRAHRRLLFAGWNGLSPDRHIQPASLGRIAQGRDPPLPSRP